jgi:hypothetical protein
MRPFSTYPEDRQTMLELCAKVEREDDNEAAIALADLVKAILTDEQFSILSEERAILRDTD